MYPSNITNLVYKSGPDYNHVSIIVIYMYSQVIQSVTICNNQFINIYYVSEHQLSHVIDASHTTPTTHANRGPQLLKLVEETLSML